MRSWQFGPPEARAINPPDPARVAFLLAQPFAHRGLHDRLRVENSRSAFRAAIATGHGIELDIQPASGSEPFVFHDDDLERLTQQRGRVDVRHADDVAQIALAGTDETIPRLDEILSLIAERVPVLIEIKTPRHRHVALCMAVRRALEGYRGDAAIMSFDPRIPAWFADHAPRIVRGLVVTDGNPHGGRIRQKIERTLALRLAKPDFVACDVRDLPSPTSIAARKRGLPVLTWTVRDAESRAIAAEYADQPIYEREP
ncbi:MAG: glycerophosphodiester phosphodiesterase family protein [Sphingomonadales bacterium]